MMRRPDALIPGNCYFWVSYYDDDLLLPMIDTLVYVGQEDDPDAGRMCLFKEPDASVNPEEPDTSPEPPAFNAFTDRQLHQIVDHPWSPAKTSGGYRPPA